MIIDYIENNKQEYGVEPICRVLTEHGCPIAPSTYYEARGRAASKRAVRDEELKVEIARVHGENYSVYGARDERPAVTHSAASFGDEIEDLQFGVAWDRGCQQLRVALKNSLAADRLGEIGSDHCNGVLVLVKPHPAVASKNVRDAGIGAACAWPRGI